MSLIFRRPAVLVRSRIWTVNCSWRRASRSSVDGDSSVVLAIETSCDDTSVALVECTHYPSRDGEGDTSKSSKDRHSLDVVFHKKVTANNNEYTGIHPLVALESHRSNLARLVKQALSTFRSHQMLGLPDGEDRQSHKPLKPDLVAVTRGPGMRSNLSVGLDTAKGLAVAWDVPLIGVHHMQAHALTPRLVTAQRNNLLGQSFAMTPLEPDFPFLGILVSGGHTMLIESSEITKHTILAETQDIALGDCLDKAARAILPPNLLQHAFGRALEKFAFETEVEVLADGVAVGDGVLPNGKRHLLSASLRPSKPKYDFAPPSRRREELERRLSQWGWALRPPLSDSKGRDKSSKRMIYSFAGLLSSIERFMKYRVDQDGVVATEPRLPDHVGLLERQGMAREVQRIAFEHLASRILLHFDAINNQWAGDTIVVSGGVASNKFLRHVLRSILDARGYNHIKLCFPPVELCTDNALMIAWTGIEMYSAGYSSTLDIGPIRKWSVDPSAQDGGILGVDGWIKENNGDL